MPRLALKYELVACVLLDSTVMYSNGAPRLGRGRIRMSVLDTPESTIVCLSRNRIVPPQKDAAVHAHVVYFSWH